MLCICKELLPIWEPQPFTKGRVYEYKIYPKDGAERWHPIKDCTAKYRAYAVRCDLMNYQDVINSQKRCNIIAEQRTTAYVEGDRFYTLIPASMFRTLFKPLPRKGLRLQKTRRRKKACS